MSSTRAFLVFVAFALCATEAQAADINLRNQTGNDFVRFWIRSNENKKWNGPHTITGESVYPLEGFGPGVYDFLYHAKGRMIHSHGVKLQRGGIYDIAVGGGAGHYPAFTHFPPEIFGVSGDDGMGAILPPEDANRPDRPRFGVDCYKCDDGIHLRSVSADGPAANCRDQDGNLIRLKADDHIVAINDVAPRSYEHFLQLTQQSPRIAELVVTVGGRRMTVGAALWSNRPRLGVNGRKCAKGIHLESVDANSPALRCRRASGGGWHLERGEHILEVDGLAPENYQQFVDLIQAAGRTVHLLILDTDGNEVAVTTQLW